jgi:NAD(P)-dependent dehydrogenase (short-subunit alcohol dehydrogenase family)
VSTVILVTGASGSIGRATAIRLARGGHQVYAAARRQEPLALMASQNPGIQAVPLDVTDAASIAAAAGRISEGTAGRGPDVIINAAGIAVLGPAEAIPAEQVRHQFEVNLLGPLAVAAAFLPAMRSRGSGRIVNVSSILGRFALPGTGVYSASKFALEALSDAMRAELAPLGVSVILVEPGVTDTPLYSGAVARADDFATGFRPYLATVPAGAALPDRLMRQASSAEDVAAVIATAATARRPRARYLPGARNRFNTGLLTSLPARFGDRIKTRIASAQEVADPAAGSKAVRPGA